MAQQDRDAAAPLTQATVGTQADESALATPRVQLSNAEDAGASVARRNTYADPATLPSKPQTPAPATSPLPSVTPRFIEMHVQPQLRAATTPMRETKSNMPAPVPTIHVSIGRIEVRAATQPSPNSRRSTAAPDKSPLDDYLGRRGNSKGEGR